MEKKIKEWLRNCYKCQQFKIHQRDAVNRMIGHSPHEIVEGHSLFVSLKRNQNINLDEINEKSNEAKRKGVDNMNKKVKKRVYKIGDIVFRKFEVKGKDKPYWWGPYKIKQIDEKYNNVTLSNDKKRIKVNLRKIRLFRMGSMLVLEPTFVYFFN